MKKEDANNKLMTPSNILVVIAMVMIIAVIAVAAVIHQNSSTRTTSDVEASDQRLHAPVPVHIPGNGLSRDAGTSDPTVKPHE